MLHPPDDTDPEPLYIGDTLVPPELRPMAELLLQLNPLEFLALVIKAVMSDRITNEEVLRICVTYKTAIVEWRIWK